MSTLTRHQKILSSLRGHWSLNPDAKHPWIVESDSNVPEIKAAIVKIGYKPFAELIAKAPEMLELLDLLIAHLEYCAVDDIDENWDEEAMEAMWTRIERFKEWEKEAA